MDLTSDALTKADILKKINVNVVFYEDLYNYNDIDSLLKNDAVILMYRSTPFFGHWTCLIRNGNVIEFFDSYGDLPDQQKKTIDINFQKQSNQYRNRLIDLLIRKAEHLNAAGEPKYEIHYNEFKFQGKEASTCGKHCIARILFRHLDTYQYHDWINQFNESPDEIVRIIYD